jgi:ubiquinol-cytochrome c reductase cytochrome c subunit
MRRILSTALLALVLCSSAAADAVRTGDHLYGRYCASCHSTGVAPSLRGVGALAADFYLRTGYMPLPHLGVQPRRTRVLLGESQIRALVAYVAALGPGPTIPTPNPARGNIAEGLHLFTDHCAGCHQVVAVGGYITGAVAPPLSRDSPREIAEAVRIGPSVMPTFTAKAISDRQLDSIVRYVEYARHPDDRGGWAIGRLGPIPEGLVTWFLAATVLVGVCLLLGRRLRT